MTLCEIDEVDLILGNTFETDTLDMRSRLVCFVVCHNGKEVTLKLTSNPMVGWKQVEFGLDRPKKNENWWLWFEWKKSKGSRGRQGKMGLSYSTHKVLRRYKNVLINKLP